MKNENLTLILQTWRIWWAPNNASKWQIRFNSTFEGLSPNRIKKEIVVRQTKIFYGEMESRGNLIFFLFSLYVRYSSPPWLFLKFLIFHSIGPTDLLQPSITSHFKNFPSIYDILREVSKLQHRKKNCVPNLALY